MIGEPGDRPTRYLLRGGHVYSPVDPFATAMLVIDGTIRWIGSDTGADVHRDIVQQVVDLRGSLVTPAFVDAHVHATATGLGMTGLDLREVDDAGSLLAAIAEHARTLPGDAVVWGHGWDDTAWRDPSLPGRGQIEAAVQGRPAYLSCVDVHSALVSQTLVDRNPEMSGSPGFDPDGPLTRQAHGQARHAAFGLLSDGQRRSAQEATLARAAELGIACLHEMSGPTISGEDDLRALLSLADSTPSPAVLGYWGEWSAIELARDIGARGCAGDLFVDGSLGSHTACLRTPYADREDSRGVAYLDSEALVEHIARCTDAGVQAGFHVIGDAATDMVFDAFAAVARDRGDAAVRACRHRLEHIEMPDESHLRMMGEWGIVASVQSAFDAAWGGPSGMYATRVGAGRAARMNPFAQAVALGVTLALGSDAPVTALDPWGGVRSAVWHRTPEHRISTRAAFAAHTRGGRRAAREEDVEPGVLREDVPATYAIWEPVPLVVQAPDDRIAAWSTDPRSGTPGLPDLTEDAPSPRCWRTVRSGRAIYDSGDLEAVAP